MQLIYDAQFPPTIEHSDLLCPGRDQHHLQWAYKRLTELWCARLR